MRNSHLLNHTFAFCLLTLLITLAFTLSIQFIQDNSSFLAKNYLSQSFQKRINDLNNLKEKENSPNSDKVNILGVEYLFSSQYFLNPTIILFKQGYINNQSRHLSGDYRQMKLDIKSTSPSRLIHPLPLNKPKDPRDKKIIILPYISTNPGKNPTFRI